MLSALEVPFMRHAACASSFLCLAATGLLLGPLAGCPDRSIDKVTPQQGRVEYKDIPVKPNRNVDILFLIDDSPSMLDKQINLAANFPRFIDVLSSIPGGLPEVHIGVATSDLGTKGAADAAPGPTIGGTAPGACSGFGKGGALQTFGAPVTGAQYISDILDPATMDGTRLRNYTGNLTDVFSQMAKGAGAAGCGFEQHLEAVKQAFLPTNTANAGFLRPEAFLAVIFIADEDDCSMAHSSLLGNDPALGPLVNGNPLSFRCTQFGILCDQGGSTTDAMNQIGPKSQCHPNDDSAYLTKVNDYVTFLKGLKEDPNKVIVAGIMGTTDPFAVELRPTFPGSTTLTQALAHSCNYTGGDGKLEVADPPIRIKTFLDQFPNRSTFAPICQQDLSGGLVQIADLLKTVIGDPCIEGQLADVDPTTPGTQYECSVSEVTNINTSMQQETIVPQCPDTGSTTTVCWHLVTDTVACPATPDHLILKVENSDTLQLDTHVIANCVTEVTSGP
jgi:hypothetical protein